MAGRVLILADMVVAPNESIVSHRSMHGQAIKTVQYILITPTAHIHLHRRLAAYGRLLGLGLAVHLPAPLGGRCLVLVPTLLWQLSPPR